MKIIDLIELLINNKVMPKHIIFEEEDYYWVSSANDYICNDHDATQLFNNQYNMSNLPLFLGKRVEILEDTPKIITAESLKNAINKLDKSTALIGEKIKDFYREEKKIPEKLTDILRVDDLIPPVNENMYKIWTQTIKNQNKINEICDYLKSKGDE